MNTALAPEGADNSTPEQAYHSPAEILAGWSAVAAVVTENQYVAKVADRAVAIPGVTSGEGFTSAISEIKAQVEQAQVYFESESAAVGISLSAELAVTLAGMFECAEAFHVAKVFNGNGTLSASEMKEFVEWIDEQANKQERAMNQLVRSFAASDKDYAPLAEMLMHMVDDLRLPFEDRGVTFVASLDCPPLAGDIIGAMYETCCFTENPSVSTDATGNLILTGPAVTYNFLENKSQVYEACVLTISAETPVQRGANRWLISPETSLSQHSPYRVGVRLQRSVEDTYIENQFIEQQGQIIAIQAQSVTVLWHKGYGTIAVEDMPVGEKGLIAAELYHERDNFSFLPSLDVDGTDRLRQASNPIVGRTVPDTGIQPLREQPPIDIRALCAAIHAAEFPVYLKAWGMEYHYDGLRQELDARTITGAEQSTITRDAVTLQAYGVQPVLLVAGSDGSAQFSVKLQAMAALGWQVVLWDNSWNQHDRIFQSVVRAQQQNDVASLQLVTGSEQDLLAVVEGIGDTAIAALSTPTGRERYTKPALRRALSYTTQRLFEISDAQLEGTPSMRIRMSADLLSLCRSAASADAVDQGKILEQAFALENDVDYATVRGRTRLETELSGYDFVDIAAALARSRLPADHPAVALRGMTCGDLSPKALQDLYRSGANFITVRAPDGSTDGVAITFSPAVVDAERPGLSERLGAAGKTGYLYWLWVNPDESGSSTRVYSKLATAYLIEQLVAGADIASAVILERNIPSLKAAVAVAGFQVLPWTVDIAGERAVRVGFNLQDLDSESTRPSFREATAIASEVFAGERSSDIASGVRRIRETVAHIDDLIEVREAWQQVLDVANATKCYEPLSLAVTRVQEAVRAMKDSIDWRVWQESLLCLLEVTHEQTQAEAVERFERILPEFAPESTNELRRIKRQLLTQIPDMEAEPDSQHSPSDRFEFDSAQFAHAPVNLQLPEVAAREVAALYEQLSGQYLQSIERMGSSMLIHAEELHRERESDRFEQYRWKRNFLREVFNERGRVFPDLEGRYESTLTSEVDTTHARLLKAYFDYGNAHIAADTYDQSVSHTIMPVIRALLYGQLPD